MAEHLRLTPRSRSQRRGVTWREQLSAASGWRPTRRPRAFDVATLPYPGFPTDLQPFALTYNAVAEGSAMVTENLFEARFRTVQELARLGADMQVDGHHVMTHGVPLLSGAPVESSDIRSGAALVIAGLVAEGLHPRQRRPPHRSWLSTLRGGAPLARRRRHPRADDEHWYE